MIDVAVTQPAGPNEALVRLRNVSKAFGRIVAVEPLDLDIRRGEFLAILGPSGCGKTTLLRMIGGALVCIGIGLAAVWIAMWAAHVFAGRPTPVEPGAFQVVAALDLAVMVPALAMGGILLWRRQPWGYVIAAIASIQGALYLLVLSVNSSLAIGRGLVPAPGELPIWGTLMLFTTGAAVVLLSNVGPREQEAA